MLFMLPDSLNPFKLLILLYAYRRSCDAYDDWSGGRVGKTALVVPAPGVLDGVFA